MQAVLEESVADDKPVLYVRNKIDQEGGARAAAWLGRTLGRSAAVSAITGEGSENLLNELADSLGNLLVSPTIRDFQNVARRASEKGARGNTGVFMIGTGKVKARSFVAACRHGAVTELITDDKTAADLVSVFDETAGFV